MIGAILIDADKVMPEAEQLLSEDDFLTGELRTIFRTCSGYFVDGKPIDALTIETQLGSEYRMPIVESITAMPSIRNWKAYAEIVKDTARRRRAWVKAQALLVELEDRKADECQTLASEICAALAATNEGDTRSAKEGFAEFFEALKKPTEYIRTGFSGLDRHTYIQRGDFIVIGARPSVGKTALTLQMMLSMCRYHKVAYFSLETGHNNLFGRMAANISGVPLPSIKNRSMDFAQLARIQEISGDQNFHTVKAAGWTVAQIKAKAIQLGAEIIFIDYIGLIRAEGIGRYEKMTNISVDLHTLAQNSGITVVALSQFNREGKGEPTMEALRDSGQVEQDADLIMLLWAPDGIQSNDRQIIIAKNKEGQVGQVSLAFDGRIQRFAEYDMRHEEAG